MKLHPSQDCISKPGKRLSVSSKTRFLDFPWGAKVGWPLREIGVHVTGIDRISGRFYGGTPSSTTHLLYFIISGAVVCDFGEGARLLRAGQWLASPAACPHWIKNERGKAEAVWVHLLDAPRWRFLHERGPGIHPIQEVTALRDSLFEAIQEAERMNIGGIEAATAYASIFRIRLLREIYYVYQREASKQHGKLAQLWTRVNSTLAEPWTVQRLAAIVGVSGSALYKQVTHHYHLKPMQMVTRLRVERAKELLLYSDWTLDAIATEVGYQTAYAFSDAFLRVSGLRPGAFRAEARMNFPTLRSTPSVTNLQGGCKKEIRLWMKSQLHT